MISKARIKLINQLKTKKQREIHKLFIVEGHRNVVDFLNNNATLSFLYAIDSWYDKSKFIADENKFFSATSEELKKLTALNTPPEVVAVFKIPEKHKLTFESNKLYLALDDIHDPGNLGTIIRTADWFGINNIICSNNTVDYTNPKVVQATMGSISRVNIHYCNLEKTLANINNSIPIFGAFLDGMPLTSVKSQNSGIIVIGSEAHGISKKIENLVTQKVTIPLYSHSTPGTPESLNASIATAIFCYAFCSQ